MDRNRSIVLVSIVVALVAAVVAAFVVTAPREVSTASPTPTASVTRTAPATTASQTTTPTPSAAQTAASGRYVSTLGYSIETPSPWRKSTCLGSSQGTLPATEVFVPVAGRDETYTDIGGNVPTLVIAVQDDPQSLTPRQWAAKDLTGGPQIEDVRYAERPAARKAITGSSFFTYYVANAGRMYAVRPQVQLSPGTTFDSATFARMIDSFRPAASP